MKIHAEDSPWKATDATICGANPLITATDPREVDCKNCQKIILKKWAEQERGNEG